jgi:CHAD domain
VGVAAAAGITFGRDQHMLAQSGQMLTTDRTAIRRGLAIRRRANRPPWGARKRRHELILAPLAASLVASLVVGVGVALVRDERDRRSLHANRVRNRQFALKGGERPADGLRRMALGQLDLAIELLEADAREVPTAVAVHDTRKALKRLRALVRVLRPELGQKTFARESAVLRDAGRRLAGARDAGVTVATLDQLMVRNREELAHLRAVRKLRSQLATERGWAEENAFADLGTRLEIAGRLRELRGRVGGWTLSDSGIEALEPGLRRLYREGRLRWRRAERRTEDGRAMHLWRKRVKDLRYAAQMLERRGSLPAGASANGHAQANGGPSGKAARKAAGAARRRQARRPRQALWIHRVAERADELGEMLGEEHDLAVLAERVRSACEPFAHEAGSRKILLKVIARRRRRLRKLALRRGRRLYRRPPKRFIARVRQAYAAQK